MLCGGLTLFAGLIILRWSQHGVLHPASAFLAGRPRRTHLRVTRTHAWQEEDGSSVSSEPRSEPRLYRRKWSEPGLYHRKWIYADPWPAGGLHFQVAQLNMLADGLSGKSLKPPSGGFTATPLEALDWEYRRSRLLEELFRHGPLPDIVAIEEIDHFSDWFEPHMAKMGYAGSFVAKQNSKCRRSLDPSLEDGSALFWRTDTFELREVEHINYLNLSPDGKPSGGTCNQVGLIATLALRGSVEVAVAATHLVAKKTVEGEQVRWRQLEQLLAKLGERRLPCIIAMDMNATPRRGPSADYDPLAYPSIERHPLNLRSSYASILGEELGYTTWKRRGDKEIKHTIDYIFASPSLEVCKVLAPPLESDIVPERLPGWQYPSDHIALIAEFKIPDSNQL
mmetsp:Transcript_52028/g.111349  ORF Transcript_52028/g.111349 Transcript_52028/m.111349 type:complete len:395 (-) Transcript_52028:19-1203(-)